MTPTRYKYSSTPPTIDPDPQHAFNDIPLITTEFPSYRRLVGMEYAPQSLWAVGSHGVWRSVVAGARSDGT